MERDHCSSIKVQNLHLNNGGDYQVLKKSGQTNGVCSHRDDNDWEEITIEVPWGTVQGKWWGPRNKQPIIALHGWQDNAGSFDGLCPLLPEHIPILCLDLPGHGKSSKHPQGMQYFLWWDGILLLRRIIRNFGWRNVTLMGHSLGGALTFMYASAYPTEVVKLINIDMAGPTVRNVNKAADSVGQSLDKFLDFENLPESKTPCYTYEKMIDIIMEAYDGSVDEKSVRILMKRGVAPAKANFNKEGYYFVRDQRLKVSALGMFSTDQVLAYAKRIRCKVLNIRGDPGMKFEYPEVYEEVINILKENCPEVIYKKVPGTHHLHLVTPERVAPHISDFLLRS